MLWEVLKVRISGLYSDSLLCPKYIHLQHYKVIACSGRNYEFVYFPINQKRREGRKFRDRKWIVIQHTIGEKLLESEALDTILSYRKVE